MVRVMNIYHFSKQSIEQLKSDLVGGCMISSNELVLAKADHAIEIRTLNEDSNEGQEQFKNFATVDDVEQIIYCQNGDYIATLESRICNYEQAEKRFVRVYTNFDLLKSNTDEDYTNTAMRARIAGKITPMHKSLEMIELSLNYNPTLIACCQVTGNLLVSHKNILQIFEFRCCSNDNTKHQYIDFFEAQFQVELEFQPLKLVIHENFISCCNKFYFCAFKVSETNDQPSSESNIYSSSDFPTKCSSNINLEENVDYEAICNRTELNGYQFDVKMSSSDMELSNSLTTQGGDEMRPSVVNDLLIVLRYTNQPPTSFAISPKYVINSLLQLKLMPLEINGILRDNNDVFKCLYIKPLYLKQSTGKNGDGSGFFMNSRFHNNFYGCAILITTQQDGYLYQFNNITVCDEEINKSPLKQSQAHFLNVYPFTSTVIDVVLDATVLHALTENGIESYTCRIGQKLFCELAADSTRSEDLSLYKNIASSISLINLRPFMGIQFMVSNEECLILMASSTSTPTQDEDTTSNWTIYNLKYPSVEDISVDFKEFADKSLRKFPSVYVSLLEEIHLMIRTHLELATFRRQENCENANAVHCSELTVNATNNLGSLYKESCLSLADFYIMSNNPDEYKLAISYYKMGQMNLINVFQRFLDLNSMTLKSAPTGMIYTIKTFFKNLNCDSTKYDEIFSSAINMVQFEAVEGSEEIAGQQQNISTKSVKFGDALIQLFGLYAPKEISLLALESQVFREYMDEKIHELLCDFQEKSNEELLCIILHLLKKDEIVAANMIMNQINDKDLLDLLIKHWNILFEFSIYSGPESTTKSKKNKLTDASQNVQNSIISFSDFTELCFLTNQNVDKNILLSDVLLVHLYDTKNIQFDGILKLFMEYLASQLGHESYSNGQNILKMLLERYLMKYYEIKNQLDVDLSLLSTTSSANTTTTMSSSGSGTSTDSLQQPGNTALSASKIDSTLGWNDQELFVNITNSNSNRHALKILIRIYLSQLKTLTTKYYHKQATNPADPRKTLNKNQLIKLIDEMSNSLFINHRHVTKYDKIATLLINYKSNILFIDERFRYLDWMPPFEDNLMNILNDEVEAKTKHYDFATLDRDLLITLIKLQALLCSNELTSDIVKEILQFIQGNQTIIGFESILVCIYPLHQSIDLIIKNCPQCILEYGRCHFKINSDWTYLIRSLQKKINEFEVTENNLPNILFYHRLLKETLEYLATTKGLETILKIFPEDKFLIDQTLFTKSLSKNSNEFDDYLRLCVDKERSDKIKQMITNTGYQLWDAINK